MAFGDNLTSQAKVTSGDQVIILSTHGGARRTSVAAISDFVKAAIGVVPIPTPGGGSTGGGTTPVQSFNWGSIGGSIALQTDLVNALNAKQAKLPTGGNNANFLRGDGTWAVPPAPAPVATPARWGEILGSVSNQTDLATLLNRLLPEGGTPGQVLSRTSGGYAWVTPSSTGGGTTTPPDTTTPPAQEDYTAGTAAMDSSGSNMRTQTASLT